MMRLRSGRVPTPPSAHADVEVHWTNGRVEHFSGVDANQLITITEGHGMVKVAMPAFKK